MPPSLRATFGSSKYVEGVVGRKKIYLLGIILKLKINNTKIFYDDISWIWLGYWLIKNDLTDSINLEFVKKFKTE